MSNILSPPQAGVYTWEHPGGKFEVCLRPNFVFYCQSFPAAAVWSFQDNKLTVDWKNYGKYELILNDSDVLEGSVVGISTKWRKMSFLRPLSDAEAILFVSEFILYYTSLLSFSLYIFFK